MKTVNERMREIHEKSLNRQYISWGTLKRLELSIREENMKKDNLDKHKSPEEIVKDIHVLSTMKDISPFVKKSLQKEAKKWIKYIELHSEDMHKEDPYDNMYHKGEISFIEHFFFFKPKKLKYENK